MNTRILFPLLFIVTSSSASTDNWAIKNGWCQTMTEDSQMLVILRNGTIDIIDLMQGYPSGVQTLLGSRISTNGNLIPTSQMCNQQTRFKAVKVKAEQVSGTVKKAVHSTTERSVSILRAFGVRIELTRGDVLRVCSGFVTSLTVFSPRQTTTVNKDSVLQVVRQTYARKYDKEITGTADFDSYGVRGNKAEFEVFSPENRAYDKVTVTVGADSNAIGTSTEFVGKQPVCWTAALFYCPEALSHVNRWLSSQQLTAMYLLKIAREYIPDWLSAMPKGSCAGGTGVLNLVPENN